MPTMKTDSALDKVKATLKRGIGLVGRRFSLVSERTFGRPVALFAVREANLGSINPELDVHRLRTLRVFPTMEHVLQDRWDERYVRGSIYAIEVDALLKPPSELEANPSAYWKVLNADQGCFYMNEVAVYYPVDDRPAVSPEHRIRVFHVEVLQNQTLEVSERGERLREGLWEVCVEQVKRSQVGTSGCRVVAVRGLERSSLVEAQRALSGMSPSLEGFPPSLRWE